MVNVNSTALPIHKQSRYVLTESGSRQRCYSAATDISDHVMDSVKVCLSIHFMSSFN